MKNICEKFCCKQTSTWKIIVLAFIYVNLHPAYSIKWCIYVSFSTLCIWTDDTYMRQSAPKMLTKNMVYEP